MPAKYHTIRQCAERLGLTKDLPLLRAIERGELKAVNVGSGLVRPTWRISEEALQDFIDRRTSKPTTPADRRKRKRQIDEAIEFFPV